MSIQTTKTYKTSEGGRSIRVDDANAALQSIVKSALSATSGQHLGLDDHILSLCDRRSADKRFPTTPIPSPHHTDRLCNLLRLFGGRSKLSLGHSDAILQPNVSLLGPPHANRAKQVGRGEGDAKQI